MGYTHYWNQANELDAETFRKAVYDCRTICGVLRVPLADADGLGNPDFDPDYIALNGYDDDGYEPFVVERVEQGFAFCKTERRPYDIAVQCCLIVLAHYFGDQFIVSSDGTHDEWAPAREACQASLGYGQDFQLAPM